MSRTFRNRRISQSQTMEDLAEIKLLIEIHGKIEKSRNIDCIYDYDDIQHLSYVLSNAKYRFNMYGVENALNFIEKEIIGMKLFLVKVGVDYGNWHGCLKKSVKEFCKKQRRCGKKQLLNIVTQKIDLEQVENIEDENYFIDMGKEKVKGAVWYFD